MRRCRRRHRPRTCCLVDWTWLDSPSQTPREVEHSGSKNVGSFYILFNKKIPPLKKWHVDLTCHFLIEKSLLYELFIRNMHLGFFDKVDKLSWILDHLKGTTLDYLIPEQAVRVTIPTFWWIRPESPSRLEKMEKSVRIANSNVRIWFEIISSIRNNCTSQFSLTPYLKRFTANP